MNHTIIHKNRNLISRNEGKIKSYESCLDIRAWSHDVGVRDRYLREWIKSDMPVCFMPVCTLTSLLKIMTCKSRGKTTPRCHPDCKSKVLLESICTSCQAIKECLKVNGKFDKYIKEEEFETSHWPCERCLDALKSIKIFWKIIVEKIFNIQVGKSHEFDTPTDNFIRVNGVKSTAKVWERDIVQQAILIKKIVPVLNDEGKIQSDDKFYNLKNTVNFESIPQARNANYKLKGEKFSFENLQRNKVILMNKSFSEKPSRKLNRSISVKVKTVDNACSTCNLETENEELKSHMANLKYLQDKFNLHKIEIDKLRQENLRLKCKLLNSRISPYEKSNIHTRAILSPDKNATTLQSFENDVERQTESDSTKNIDSEMIITMKNCQNKSFKHVSLLQVLHKTNHPVMADMNINELSSTKEDPINLLNKVQTTFGAIVKREINIVVEKEPRSKRTDIEATFRKVNACRLATLDSTPSASSESNFLSTKTTSDKVEHFNL